MAKADHVLAALKRDGWVEVRRAGSHRVLVKTIDNASGAEVVTFDLSLVPPGRLIPTWPPRTWASRKRRFARRLPAVSHCNTTSVTFDHWELVLPS